jgi:rhodanese-related sulfurtransferase
MLLNRFRQEPDEREISNSEASAVYDAGEAVFVDVREQDEWDEGHMPGAIHIPLGELSNRGSELPADRRIITVCHSGQRSLYAVDLLQALGYGDVKSMAGGMVEWAGSGRPVE